MSLFKINSFIMVQETFLYGESSYNFLWIFPQYLHQANESLHWSLYIWKNKPFKILYHIPHILTATQDWYYPSQLFLKWKSSKMGDQEAFITYYLNRVMFSILLFCDDPCSCYWNYVVKVQNLCNLSMTMCDLSCIVQCRSAASSIELTILETFSGLS